AAVGLLIAYVARRDHWTAADWRGFVRVFVGFAALLVADGLLTLLLRSGVPPYLLGGAISLPWISGLLQLVVVVGLFVLVNFWVAYLIRWLLRIDGLSVRYGGRRLFEQLFGGATLVVIGLLALGAVPL